jgi:hypothetical protein
MCKWEISQGLSTRLMLAKANNTLSMVSQTS